MALAVGSARITAVQRLAVCADGGKQCPGEPDEGAMQVDLVQSSAWCCARLGWVRLVLCTAMQGEGVGRLGLLRRRPDLCADVEAPVRGWRRWRAGRWQLRWPARVARCVRWWARAAEVLELVCSARAKQIWAGSEADVQRRLEAGRSLYKDLSRAEQASCSVYCVKGQATGRLVVRSSEIDPVTALILPGAGEALLGQSQEGAERPLRSPSSGLLGDLHSKGMSGTSSPSVQLASCRGRWPDTASGGQIFG
ncbi:hypothetical protein Taro_005340 [Colocasia esculenta]|uniref:Uncharacterized protein n=1 Tax=Colocasia esculenta TaxID=4460 RepID=A0A843TPP1_COLES|nr:hypothetical protein [Colocasia esculenta]